MSTSSDAGEPSATYRGWILSVLILVYTFNFIDRQIIGILAIPIKAELGLTDTQVGLMSGLAFALFYTFLGIPIAMLADRRNRVLIMTIALTVWSGFTMVCGTAQNYGQLFLARLGVGVGEAGGVAPAYSLIADYFPSHQRSRALAVYSFGIPIGSATGIVLGGILTAYFDWRIAFFIVGGAGVLIAPLLKWTVREPERGRYDAAPPVTPPTDLVKAIREVSATLVRKPSFWGLSLGAAFSSMMGYGLFLWVPSFLVRSFGTELPVFMGFLPGALVPPDPSPILFAAYYYGAIVLVGGIAGIWMGGLLADKFGAERKSAYALVPAAAFALTVPFLIIGVLTPSLGLAFVVLLVPTALSLVWLGPVISAFQHLVPPHMRSTASAIFLFINNLIGIGAGQTVIGLISDSLALRLGDESLRYAILCGCSFYVIAAILMALTAPRLAQDWEQG
ncbi:MAG: MFS transporter [Pseudomonadota bacterium]